MKQHWIIEKLCKSYKQQQVLKNISISLDPKQITGLLGVNGAGKSTLFKSMLNMISTDSGSYTAPPDSTIGYLPDLTIFPDSLTSLQLIRHALRVKSSPISNAEPLLKEIGLNQRSWNQRVSTYSKGMKQRTALAFAMAGNPDWLLLDEPMSGLDAIGRKRLLELLKLKHHEGAGIFVCSHIVPDLVRLCDRILIVSNGTLIEDISIKEHSMNEISIVEEILEKASTQ